ncbi:MAG: hypothetical protein KDK70_17125 [Myxococcales bacterium]|nr:hypothetical protein [Myxococcales bacterium]
MAEDVERSEEGEDGRDSASEAASEAESEPAAASGEGESAEAHDSPAQGTTSADTKPSAAPAARRRLSMLWWALPVLMIVEFYVYGHDGRLEICVGKEGDTDFSLVGQERTDENRWKFPRCETQLNLGLRSTKETAVPEGIKVACRGATIFRHQGETKACIAGEGGWEHRVQGHFVPPWEPAYYRHLFWFLQ